MFFLRIAFGSPPIRAVRHEWRPLDAAQHKDADGGLGEGDRYNPLSLVSVPQRRLSDVEQQ